MGYFDSVGSVSSLLCEENEASWFSDKGNEDTCTSDDQDDCVVLGSEDIDYIEKLIQKETTFGFECCVPSDRCSKTGNGWLKSARLNAIEWIFHTRAVFGLQLLTAYLSVTYLDRFLLKRSIDEGKLLVLTTLEWKMASMTPLLYLPYFINKICGEGTTKALVSRAAELIVAMVKDINSLDHRPSVIAAAAVLAASKSQFTRKELELKMSLISLWNSQENEHILSCFLAMQCLQMKKLKTPTLMISPTSSSNLSSWIDAKEKSSLAVGTGIKRRLTFDDWDPNSPASKICR